MPRKPGRTNVADKLLPEAAEILRARCPDRSRGMRRMDAARVLVAEFEDCSMSLAEKLVDMLRRSGALQQQGWIYFAGAKISTAAPSPVPELTLDD